MSRADRDLTVGGFRGGTALRWSRPGSMVILGMLAVRFDDHREWWVARWVLERLFESALEDQLLAPALGEWLYVARSSGGLTLASLDPLVARALVDGLVATARAELARLGSVEPASHDGSYKAALEKLVALAP